MFLQGVSVICSISRISHRGVLGPLTMQCCGKCCKLFNLYDRSSRGRSRFDTYLSDTYIPPRVLTLKINRPETVPGRFSKVRIHEDKNNQGKNPDGEDREKSDQQNQKDMEESNVLTGGKAGIFFKFGLHNFQDSQEHVAKHEEYRFR